jgi:hypothetical protein
VFTFKIEVQENSRDNVFFVPVEMRGDRFQGVLRDGDLIEVLAPWQPGQTLLTTQVSNLTTGSQFVVLN